MILVVMALSRTRVVLLSVAATLYLVIHALYRFSGTYSTIVPKGPAKLVSRPADQTASTSETQHNPIEAMYRRLVALTAFSSNHYREALDMIGSVQKYLPHTKIIVYDIGLTAKERENVLTFCNVELRSFNFNKYPPYVKMNLKNYAWKPLILQELVDEDYDVILYGDASLRVTAHNITTALQCLLDFPFLDIRASRVSSVMSVTHDEMIKYFQFPPSRRYMAHWREIESGGWFLLVNDLTRQKLIAPWVDCALHKECIAPEGARRECNYELKFNVHKDGTYVGCHRYDQSALNIILAKHFGLHVWNKVVKRKITRQLARYPQGIHPVMHHPHCNHMQIWA